jgi:hypothetical protein
MSQYGPYWLMEAFTGKLGYPGVVQALAIAELALRSKGMPTLTIDPAPEWSPIPLIEYNLGDQVPVYASSAFRQPIHPVINATTGLWDGLCRIQAIPITIPDGAPETVVAMLVTLPPVAQTPTPQAALVTNMITNLVSSGPQAPQRRTQIILAGRRRSI